jgi:Ser/Thr protein kinase RdoA (MazF antagonist)
VRGYRDVSALSQGEENALPMFIMLRRILLTAWIGSHPETPTAADLGSAYTGGTVELAEAYLARS